MYLEVSFYAYAATVWLTEAKLLQKRLSNKKILEIAEYVNSDIQAHYTYMCDILCITPKN